MRLLRLSIEISFAASAFCWLVAIATVDRNDWSLTSLVMFMMVINLFLGTINLHRYRRATR